MHEIPLLNLSLSFLPVIVVITILFAWSLEWGKAIYAMARMVLQLLLVGYVLVYIFEATQAWAVLLVLTFMLVAASWIALRSVREDRWKKVPIALASVALGSVFTLLLITQIVLSLEPRWNPQMVIPLAGMIFANAMNCVSLAAERFASEVDNGATYIEARSIAMRASLIPITNSLFSVGLVSLPGMMTGQILSGTSPLIAVRYQVMVMSMVFGSGGIAAACYLWWQRQQPATTKTQKDERNNPTCTQGDEV